MTEIYGFFKNVSDIGIARGFDLSKIFPTLLSNGLLDGGSRLLVEATVPATMAVRVGTGRAWIENYWYENEREKILAISPSHATLPRIDRVVVRLLYERDINWTEDMTIRAVVKIGTPHATPTAPALTRDRSMYELSLAQVLISAGATTIASGAITDERRNSLLCGDAHSALKTRAVVALPDANVTLTASQLIDSGIFTIAPSVARTYTTDTAANIIAGIPGFQVGDWFDFSVISWSTAAVTVTLSGGFGVALVGTPSINNASGTWRALITSPTTVTIYRIT